MRKILFTTLLTVASYRKASLALLFCSLFSVAWSQGNLQFNQIIMFDLPASGTQAITVPAGKVWKIESVGNGGSAPYVMLRNAAVQSIAQFGAATNANSTPLPYWLPSGFTGSFLANSVNRTSVSILEFNVVP